jgi:hypothetical protein
MWKYVPRSLDHLCKFRLGQFWRSYDGVTDASECDLAQIARFEHRDSVDFPICNLIGDDGDWP